MNDIISDWFITGINTIMQSVVLVVVVGMLSTVAILNTHISEEQGINTEIAAFNEFNEYDFSHVYAADVVSAVVRYHGDPYVTVQSAKGTYTWDSSTPTANYATAYIESKMATNTIYDADIIKSPSGNIIGLKFQAHTAGCGR